MINKRSINTLFLWATLSILSLSLAAITVRPVLAEQGKDKMSLTKAFDSVLYTGSLESTRIVLGGLEQRGGVSSVAVNSRGNVFLLFNDPGMPNELRYSIQRFASDGRWLGEVPLNPSVWELPVYIHGLSTGKNGVLYAAVQWTFERGGIVVVDEKGNLLHKVGIPYFGPQRVAVDADGRVWVVGHEYDQEKLSNAESSDPRKPNGEQLRVYSHDLKLVDIPIQHQKVSETKSVLAVMGNEVIYYVQGTGAIKLFRQGRLVQSLEVRQLTSCAPPEELAEGQFTTVRAVTGVFKIRDRFLISGFYNYIPRNPDGEVMSKNFMALVSVNGDPMTAELSPPHDFVAVAYANGHLISLSSESREAIKLLKMRLKL